jgi:predicted NUDIX family NTP pyrophosphohydrolase
MTKISAGLLMFRKKNDCLEVLLAHPGGPFWAKKDEGVWGVPKGETDGEADYLSVAKREFEEETGFETQGDFYPLGSVVQKSGKTVYAWAFEGDCDPKLAKSNTFKMEWPPKSGEMREFPEIDRVGFFGIEEAKKKILPAQAEFLDRLRGLIFKT